MDFELKIKKVHALREYTRQDGTQGCARTIILTEDANTAYPDELVANCYGDMARNFNYAEGTKHRFSLRFSIKQYGEGFVGQNINIDKIAD